VESWTLEASGSLTGCGEEVALVSFDEENTAPSCGSWSSGVFGGCVPPEDAISTTTWSVTRTIEHAVDAGPVEIKVVRGHGPNVVLAEAEASCP
jgi:hypothetical protein